jgi:hypothetical protein
MLKCMCKADLFVRLAHDSLSQAHSREPADDLCTLRYHCVLGDNRGKSLRIIIALKHAHYSYYQSLAAVPSPPPRPKVTRNHTKRLPVFPRGPSGTRVVCHTKHVILLTVTPETVFSHTLEAPGMRTADDTRHVLDEDVFQPAVRSMQDSMQVLGHRVRRTLPRCLKTCHNTFNCQLDGLCHRWHTFVAHAFLAPAIVGRCGGSLGDPRRLVFVCHGSDAVLRRIAAVWEFRLPCMMKRIGSFRSHSLRFVCTPQIMSHMRILRYSCNLRMRILQSHGYLLLLDRWTGLHSIFIFRDLLCNAREISATHFFHFFHFFRGAISRCSRSFLPRDSTQRSWHWALPSLSNNLTSPALVHFLTPPHSFPRARSLVAPPTIHPQSLLTRTAHPRSLAT